MYVYTHSLKVKLLTRWHVNQNRSCSLTIMAYICQTIMYDHAPNIKLLTK